MYCFIVPCYFILSFELNKAFIDIALQNALHFKVFFSYKTMVKPNFLVDKANMKHKPTTGCPL